ncbi:MAG: UpxY family transcription antiterminator [Saprospiraceae bacterium]
MTSASSPRRFEPIIQLHPEEERWFAVRTRPRTEKKVAYLFERSGIDYFLPRIKKPFVPGKRVRKHRRAATGNGEVVLLPSYIFVRINQTDYLEVLQTTYVTGFVKQRQDLLQVPEAELDLLRRIVGDKQADVVRVSQTDWQVGTAVTVIGGPLNGMEGTLVNSQNKRNFQIRIGSVDEGLHMFVETRYLRPV